MLPGKVEIATGKEGFEYILESEKWTTHTRARTQTHTFTFVLLYNI